MSWNLRFPDTRNCYFIYECPLWELFVGARCANVGLK